MKYVDAEKLLAEIEGHIKEVKETENRFHPNLGFFDAKLSGIYDVLSILDSLQQEQPDVDLEKEIDACWRNWLSPSNQKEVEGVLPKTEFAMYARHFYELGFNARKEEK